MPQVAPAAPLPLLVMRPVRVACRAASRTTRPGQSRPGCLNRLSPRQIRPSISPKPPRLTQKNFGLLKENFLYCGSVELRLACVLVPGLPMQVERQRRGGGAFIIEHPIEQGVVFACSDEAAQAGVRPGLSIYQAQQLAPQVVVVAADELTYHALHSAGEAALRAFSPALETVALGEFLVDVRHLPPHFPDDAALAQALRAAAQTASGLNVAVGLAASKFVAQQAALAAAANGVFVVAPGEEAAFVAPLPLTVLPNLPGECLRRLQLFDLYTLGDLARLPKPAMLRQVGSAFSSLRELARARSTRSRRFCATRGTIS
jgi:DNA polymerase-4